MVTERGGLGVRVAAGEAELFKVLAHPARVRVLAVLASGPASVAELCSATGLKPSHLAGQLALLRAQHLVTGRRADGRLQYWLAFPEVADLLSAAESVLSARAAADSGGLAGIGAARAGSARAGSDGSGAGRAGIGPDSEPSEGGAILTEESAAVLEESLGRRALITDAVRSVSARTGRSSEQALAGLLTEARERSLTLAEVSSEAVAERGTD
ncbi:metalloregulator ArsR/SmtB family transcription factor [Arthrobacter globiformis]|uniref:ArsR/SmtB family transcription factor n=1 Tax=Arthrobacter globiformis TaxID=1665 RepID=UPI00397D42A7